MTKALLRCDCINVCGDDPWLVDGRSTPCDGQMRERAEKEKRDQIREMASQLTIQAQVDGQVVVSAEQMKAIRALMSNH